MSLIPLSTAIIGANPFYASSAAMYGFIMLMTTLSFAIMRTYTMKKGLVHRDKDKKLTLNIFKVSIKARTKSFFGAAAYLLSIPLAFINVYLSFVCFAIPPIIFFIPDGIDDEAMANRISEKNG
jgi:uncharacterized membrane protein